MRGRMYWLKGDGGREKGKVKRKERMRDGGKGEENVFK